MDRERELTPERLRNITLLAATAVLLYLTYRIALPLLPALAWALALAVIAYPMQTFIDRKLKRPSLAAGTSVVIAAAAVLGPAVFVGERIVAEATSALAFLSDRTKVEEFLSQLAGDPRAGALLRWVERNVDGVQIQEAAQRLLGRAGAVMKDSLGAAVQLFIALFLLFFLLRDRSAILRSLRALSPLPEADTARIFQRVADTIHATVFGTVVVAMVQGSLGGLMFWFLGLPAPVLWGFVMGILAIVPVLGAFVVWVPAALYLAISGDWVKAASLTVWGAFVVGTIDNLLYPALVGQRMRLHTAVVFVAMLGGLGVFGASGVVLGPVIVAVTLAVIEIWRCRLAQGEAGPL